MPKPAPYARQVSRQREHVRTRTNPVATRTTDQILQATPITQAERAGAKGTLGSKPTRRPKSGR